MKKFLAIFAILAVAFASAQVYRAGAFYGDIALTSVSNYTALGQLPPNACVVDINLMEASASTNTLSTNSIAIGVVSNTNFFLPATQVPMVPVPGVIRPTTTLTNVGVTLSATRPTIIYGYLTRVGAQVCAKGSVRVVVHYIQK